MQRVIISDKGSLRKIANLEQSPCLSLFPHKETEEGVSRDDEKHAFRQLGCSEAIANLCNHSHVEKSSAFFTVVFTEKRDTAQVAAAFGPS